MLPQRRSMSTGRPSVISMTDHHKRSKSMSKSVNDDQKSLLSNGSSRMTNGTSKYAQSQSLSRAITQNSGPGNLQDFRDNLLDNGDFSLHPFFLSFRDKVVESKYCDFMYTNGGFYGGKLWHIIAIVVLASFLFVYSRKGLYFSGGHQTFFEPAAIMMTISGIVTMLILGTLFYGPLRRHRETLYILTLMTHWPAVAIFVLHGKERDQNTYGPPLMCFFFCSFITFARFCRVILFLSVTPMVVFFSVTFGVSGYWDNRSYFEMIHWFTMVPVILLLHRIERRLRLCFAEVEIAHDAMITVDEKSELAKEMVVNFFPPTITRNLLASARPPSEFEYQAVILIFTDLKGFTAWSSERGPSEVVEMLTAMVEVMDEFANRNGVEKIATIGDAFVGANFRPDDRRMSNPELVDDEGSMFPATEHRYSTSQVGVSDGQRCSATLHFACSILSSAVDLELRVGVAMGSVTAAIIGAHPPKADIFGDVVTKAARMEQTSKPGFVQVSEEVLSHANSHGYTKGTVDIGEEGTLMCGWASDELLVADYDTGIAMREALMDCSKTIIKNLDRVDEGSSRNSRSVDSRASIFSEVIVIEDISSDESGGMFHKVLLRFHEHEIEEQFAAFMRDSGMLQSSQQLLWVLQFMLFLATATTVCVHNTGNRLVIFGIGVDVLAFGTYLSFVGTANRFNFPLCWLFYSVPVILCALLAAECEGNEGPPGYYPSVSWSTFYALWAVGPVFCINVSMIIRVIVAVFTSFIAFVLIPVHRAVIGRDDVYLDPGLIIICACVAILVAFFVDFTLRSAFAASIRVRRMMEKAQKRRAAAERGAIDVMLPPFVSAKVMQAMAEERAATSAAVEEELDVTSIHDVMTASKSDGKSFRAEEQADDDDSSEMGSGPAHTARSLVWDYPRAIVMFLQFTNTPDENGETTPLTTTAINGIVRLVEESFASSGIQKVKTIQNTMLAVAGIEANANPQVAAIRALQTTLDIMSLFRERRNISFRVGIHSGPCFGAVIGSTGLTFDVFGDTVNTTSRLQTNTALDTVLASRNLVTLLGRHSTRFDVTPVDPIHAKGKGSMEVFRIAKLNGNNANSKMEVSTRSFNGSNLLMMDQADKSVTDANFSMSSPPQTGL